PCEQLIAYITEVIVTAEEPHGLVARHPRRRVAIPSRGRAAALSRRRPGERAQVEAEEIVQVAVRLPAKDVHIVAHGHRAVEVAPAHHERILVLVLVLLLLLLLVFGVRRRHAGPGPRGEVQEPHEVAEVPGARRATKDDETVARSIFDHGVPIE